jgi:hypothetical chaperone protein
MRIGIDFGTSYSAAAAVIRNRTQLIRFGAGDLKQFRTTVFFPHKMVDPSEFVLTHELEAEVNRTVASSKAAQTREINRVNALRTAAEKLPEAMRARALAMVPTPVVRSELQMRREAEQSVRRHWLETQMQGSRASSARLQDAIYGDEAVEAYIKGHGGWLNSSPKSMLGYPMVGNARHTITGICTHVLEHIRLTATRQLKTIVRRAVIGRPVEFRSSKGKAGSAQAIEILTAAAAAAGFDDVEFMEEPAAAAMGFHRRKIPRQRALVVDLGGGTTDIAYADVGGSASMPAILGFWGEARGGVDVDLALSLDNFMPLFGRNCTTIPVHRFSEAARIHDLRAQQDFRKYEFSACPAPYDRRLQTLQETGNTVRLNGAVERLKIQLTENEKARERIGFIEKGLAVTATRRELEVAAERDFLVPMKNLVARAAAEILEEPECVFVTGGMSRAPYVRSILRSAFPNAKLVMGDASLGVVTGLAWAAANPLKR